MPAFLFRNEKDERLSNVLLHDCVPSVGDIVTIHDIKLAVVRRDWKLEDNLRMLHLNSVVLRQIDD